MNRLREVRTKEELEQAYKELSLSTGHEKDFCIRYILGLAYNETGLPLTMLEEALLKENNR